MNLNNTPRGGEFCLVNPAIIIDASAKADAEVTTTTLYYCIDGNLYTFTSGDGDIPLETANNVDALSTLLCLVCVDSSGTVTLVNGSHILNADFDSGKKALEWPSPTEDTCPIGGLQIKNGAATEFVGGTTELDATDVKFTAHNFFAVPPHPVLTNPDA